MTVAFKAACLLTLLATAASAWAEDKVDAAAAVPAAAITTTCLVEGTIVVAKEKVLSKDCFENIGAEPDDFKRVCDAMEKTAIAVTQSVGTLPPKITHGMTCPAGAVARCKGFLHMPIINYHYKRSAHELELARESCLTQGGDWK